MAQVSLALVLFYLSNPAQQLETQEHAGFSIALNIGSHEYPMNTQKTL